MQKMKTINCMIFAALTFWSVVAPAVEPPTELAMYDYYHLYLVRTIVTDKTAMACFVTSDDKTLWALKGAFVGDLAGTINEIGKDYVVIREKILVNGSDWVVRTFRWPVTRTEDLLEHCSQPPNPRKAHSENQK